MLNFLRHFIRELISCWDTTDYYNAHEMDEYHREQKAAALKKMAEQERLKAAAEYARLRAEGKEPPEPEHIWVTTPTDEEFENFLKTGKFH
jgi:antirestriction protein